RTKMSGTTRQATLRRTAAGRTPAKAGSTDINGSLVNKNRRPNDPLFLGEGLGVNKSTIRMIPAVEPKASNNAGSNGWQRLAVATLCAHSVDRRGLYLRKAERRSLKSN